MLLFVLSFSFAVSVVMLFCHSVWLVGVCWLWKDYSLWDKVFLTLRIYSLTYILYFCFLICTLFLLFMSRKQIKEISGQCEFSALTGPEASSNKIIIWEGQGGCLAQQPDSFYWLVLKGALLGKNWYQGAEYVWEGSAGADATVLSTTQLLNSVGWV